MKVISDNQLSRRQACITHPFQFWTMMVINVFAPFFILNKRLFSCHISRSYLTIVHAQLWWHLCYMTVITYTLWGEYRVACEGYSRVIFTSKYLVNMRMEEPLLKKTPQWFCLVPMWRHNDELLYTVLGDNNEINGRLLSSGLYRLKIKWWARNKIMYVLIWIMIFGSAVWDLWKSSANRLTSTLKSLRAVRIHNSIYPLT